MKPHALPKIAQVMDRCAAESRDLGLAQGACGGDWLFTEACLPRGRGVIWVRRRKALATTIHTSDATGGVCTQHYPATLIMYALSAWGMAKTAMDREARGIWMKMPVAPRARWLG